MELHVLNGNLALAGVVEYTSLIWIERFNRVGTCEVYAPATQRNRNILKIGNYLFRTDNRRSVCRIVDVKIEDTAENGVFITATGKDAKYFLDNRVNVSLSIFSSDHAGAALENWIWHELIHGGGRRFTKPNGYYLFGLHGDATTAEGEANQKVFGLTYGGMCRQICGDLGFGYCFYIDDTTDGDNPTPDGLPLFIFRVVTGMDRRNTVIFSREMNNLGNTTYHRDIRNIGNVCYIQNPEVRWQASVLGDETYTDRVEKFLETSVTPSMSYGDIKAAFGGTWAAVQNGDDVDLKVTDLLVPVLSPWQLTRLQSWHNGDTTTKDGYYHVSAQVVIGTVKEEIVADVTDDTMFYLIDTMYDYVQLCAGVEFMNDFKESETCSFDIVDATYEYGTDYNLGDIVTVIANGETKAAQIVEVLECWDEKGYHLEPRTSYTDAGSE